MLAVAPLLRVPYPILLVLGGLAIGLVPGMPEFELEPELVFFGVLPPLLYGAAFFTSLRDLRARLSMSKDEFDETALRLQREGAVSLHHHDHPLALPEAERAGPSPVRINGM